jgi:hypothetical protein
LLQPCVKNIEVMHKRAKKTCTVCFTIHLFLSSELNSNKIK